MKFRIKFEIYGKKMVTTIDAKDEQEAKYFIMGKIKFVEVVKLPASDDDILSFFNGFHK